jgi:hypothetical protein
MRTFKDQLERYLIANDRRPSWLARKAGISPSVLSLYLRGIRGMTLKTAEKIKAVMK